MAISYKSLATSVPNWQLVTSSTPSGVAAVTFSGLSGYSKYRVVMQGLTLAAATASNFKLQVNATDCAGYGSYDYFVGQSSTFVNATAYLLQSNTTTPNFAFAEIENCLLATPKYIKTRGYEHDNSRGFTWEGFYNSASLVTSLSVVSSAVNFSSGSIYLLGAN